MSSKHYVAIMINSPASNNMSFTANDFKEASRYLKQQVKQDTMFQHKNYWNWIHYHQELIIFQKIDYYTS